MRNEIDIRSVGRIEWKQSVNRAIEQLVFELALAF
jgi:hypothetical protein